MFRQRVFQVFDKYLPSYMSSSSVSHMKYHMWVMVLRNVEMEVYSETPYGVIGIEELSYRH